MSPERIIDGDAIVYCDGAFSTPNGKTAHGLVRFTERYRICGIIDQTYAGQDAGMVLDGINRNIPVFPGLNEALSLSNPKFLVIGLAPDGGRLPSKARSVLYQAAELGLHIDSGLHDFLSRDHHLLEIAKRTGSRLRDIRKTPDREDLHFFTGEIENVSCLKLAVLGTDSAVGKRTTAWIIVHALRKTGRKAEMIGTGQTAWMQGAKYSMAMDSMINDFVSGEIEHAVVQAWKNESPDVIVLEGQGSLMNPAYPGGFEILAAGRPDKVILQHAPRRLEYDGFPGYPLHDLNHQIQAIELLSARKVIAITLNHENMEEREIPEECAKIQKECGLPCFDVLAHGSDELVHLIMNEYRAIR